MAEAPRSAAADVAEFTAKAVVAGVLLGIVFGAANAYLGLRVGLTVSASIPAAVMTVALFRLFRTRGTILEANLSQTIGSASTSLASGTIFTIPALFMWGLAPPYFQVVVLSFMGAALGLAAMIPLRRLLIVQSRDELPYPEGTACAEVLRATVGGSTASAWIFRGMALGAGIKLALSLAFLMPANVHALLPVLPKAEVAIELAPALLGVGFILGYRQAGVLVAGSIVSALVLTPLIAWAGTGLAAPLAPETTKLVTAMTANEIWARYVRYIGAGAVAAAGIITVARGLPTMISAVVAVGRGMRHEPESATRGARASAASEPRERRGTKGVPASAPRERRGAEGVPAGERAGGSGPPPREAASARSRRSPPGHPERAKVDGAKPPGEETTDRDLPGSFVIGTVVIVVAVAALVPGVFAGNMGPLPRAICAAGVGVFGILFVTVAARIVGIVGVSSQPTSGIALITLLGVASVFAAAGWTDTGARAAVLTVATIVAVAASKAGDISQDLKTGYLVGATPARQQFGQLIGASFACWAVAGTVILLGAVYTFGSRDIPAPQATLMKTIVEGVLAGALPWGLVLSGVGLAISALVCSVSPLAFAIGVYLPLGTMAAIFLGGCVRALSTRQPAEPVATKSEVDAGILAASGLVAGEGLAGVLVAGLVAAQIVPRSMPPRLDAVSGEIAVVGMLVLVSLFLYRAARSK